jgi:hypothetical protein
VAVDDEVGKAGAVACVKESDGRCDIEERVRAAHGRSTVVHSASDKLIGPRFPRTLRCRGNRSSLGARRDTALARIRRVIKPSLSPELTGHLDGVDAGRLPPGLLVAGAMDGAMMRAAERDGEFVAGFAAQRARLHAAQMVGIGWPAATDEARLLHDIAKVLAAAIAPRGRE